jgi:hypothetical protein
MFDCNDTRVRFETKSTIQWYMVCKKELKTEIETKLFHTLYEYSLSFLKLVGNN